MFTESIILSIITVLGGGGLALGKRYIEGKAATEIEQIKSRAEILEKRLRLEESDNIELREEIHQLEKDIEGLERKIEEWKRKFWRLEIDAQELRMIFLKAMEKADISTDQFEALIQRIKEND